MNMEASDGLISLVTYGAPADLHGNPEMSMFDQTWKRTTQSQFTFKSIDFVRIESTNKYRVSLSVKNTGADLLGQCYLDFVPGDSGVSRDHLVSITFRAGNVKESLSGATLKVMANDRGNDSKTESSHDHMMVPLPFFFTKKTMDYFPLIAMWTLDSQAMPEYDHVEFECEFIGEIENLMLVYQGVYLDTIERKRKHQVGMERLTTLSRTVTHHVIVEGDDDYVKHVIPLEYDDYVKDIRVLVNSGDSGVSQIKALNVRLNNQPKCHISLNAMMAQKIVPRRFYGILDNVEPIYYLPFCHDPLARVLQQTSQIHFGRIDKACIEIYIKPGTYDISLVAQSVHLLRFIKGRCLLGNPPTLTA